jgi:hypothetical protein
MQLFSFCLFNDTPTLLTPCIRHHVASNDGKIMNNELERLWKEPVMTYFEVLSQHLLEEPTKNTNSLVKIIVLRVKFRTQDLSSDNHI